MGNERGLEQGMSWFWPVQAGVRQAGVWRWGEVWQWEVAKQRERRGMLPLQRSDSYSNDHIGSLTTKLNITAFVNFLNRLHPSWVPIIGRPQLWAWHLLGHPTPQGCPNKKSYAHLSKAPQPTSPTWREVCQPNSLCCFLPKSNALPTCAVVPKSSSGLAQKEEVLHNKLSTPLKLTLTALSVHILQYEVLWHIPCYKGNLTSVRSHHGPCYAYHNVAFDTHPLLLPHTRVSRLN